MGTLFAWLSRSASHAVFLVSIVLLVLGMATNGSAWGATMRCGSDLISAGKGTTQAEVLDRCGEPHSQYGRSWLYRKSNGAVYRLTFNHEGEVYRLNSEIVR